MSNTKDPKTGLEGYMAGATDGVAARDFASFKPVKKQPAVKPRTEKSLFESVKDGEVIKDVRFQTPKKSARTPEPARLGTPEHLKSVKPGPSDKAKKTETPKANQSAMPVRGPKPSLYIETEPPWFRDAPKRSKAEVDARIAASKFKPTQPESEK